MGKLVKCFGIAKTTHPSCFLRIIIKVPGATRAVLRALCGNSACRDLVGQLANWLSYRNIMCIATTRLDLLNLVFCLWHIHIEKKNPL